jgi:GH43 family beta-xylosidase
MADNIPSDETTDPTQSQGHSMTTLVQQRADPWMVRHDDGYIYFTATVPEYDRIEIRRAGAMGELAQAEPQVVWRKHSTGVMGAHIWAPELHRLDGRWYLYFAAGAAEAIWDIRMYVLENSADNPMEGEWVERGPIQGTLWDTFALDATTFSHEGRRYLVWAQQDPAIGGNSSLFIAELKNPWTLASRPVMLSTPEYPWEVVGFRVNEGPAILHRNGRIFITYSASATDANYGMGLLWAAAEADLLDPASWTKSPDPVFSTSRETAVFGPGHNCFLVEGATGAVWNVYHARDYEHVVGDPLRDPNRHTRIQSVGWTADGMPDFGLAGGSPDNDLFSSDL